MPESFSSYLRRLAIVHGVGTRAVLDHAIRVASSESLQAVAIDRHRLSNGDTKLDGYYPYSIAVHEALRGALRHAGNAGHSIARLGQAFCRSGAGSMHHSRWWCPECIREMQARGGPIFDPLVWSLGFVAVCPRHRVRLCAACSVCGKAQPYLGGSRTNAGACHSCEAPLTAGEAVGVNCKGRDIYDAGFQAWAIVAAQGLIDLVGDESRQVHPDAFPRFLRAVAKARNLTIPKLADQMGVTDFAAWQWSRDRFRPRMDLAMVALGNLNVDPASVLTNPEETAAALPLLNENGDTALVIRKAKKLRYHDPNKVLQRLRKMRKDPKIFGVLSRSQVVNRMGISQGALTYIAGDMLKEFSAERLRRLADQRRRSKSASDRLARRLIKLLRRAGAGDKRIDIVSLMTNRFGRTSAEAKRAYGQAVADLARFERPPRRRKR